MATKAQRQHLKHLMLWLIENEPLVHYAMVRPMRTAHLYEQQCATLFASGHGITADCSETVTLLCRWAGLQDPNKHGYNGEGNTGTLLASLPHYQDPKLAGVGALAVFGPGGGDHVAMVLEPGSDPWLFSHGQERGPLKVRLSVEAAAHRAPVTFLSIAAL